MICSILDLSPTPIIEKKRVEAERVRETAWRNRRPLDSTYLMCIDYCPLEDELLKNKSHILSY